MRLTDEEMIALLTEIWEIEGVDEINFVDIATGLGYKWVEEGQYWTD